MNRKSVSTDVFLRSLGVPYNIQLFVHKPYRVVLFSERQEAGEMEVYGRCAQLSICTMRRRLSTVSNKRGKRGFFFFFHATVVACRSHTARNSVYACVARAFQLNVIARSRTRVANRRRYRCDFFSAPLETVLRMSSSPTTVVRFVVAVRPMHFIMVGFFFLIAQSSPSRRR